MAEAAAVENTQDAPEATPEAEVVDLHPSITDMLSHDPSADALGGLNVGLNTPEPEPEQAPEEKGETETAEPPPAEKEPEVVDWEARAKAFETKAIDEVGKRQALEQSIRTNQPPPEKADLFENPDQRLSQEIDPVRQEFQNRFLTLAESQARGRHGAEKYNAAQEAFLGAAQANPGLVQAAMNAADPGEFQFLEGNKLLLSKELGDGGLEAMQEKADARALVKIEDEINKRVEEKLKAVNALPPSAGDFTGKNNRQQPIDTDISLTYILNIKM